MKNELQIGKAGEHLVCADLILRGFSAMLADQGSPFDLVVEAGGTLLRVQVKTTQKSVQFKQSGNVYRFSLRHGRQNRQKALTADVYAFVILETHQIGYVAAIDVTSREHGNVIGCIEFAADNNGRSAWRKRRIESCTEFPPKPRPKIVPICHPDRPHFALGKCRSCYQQQRYLAVEGKDRKHRAV